MAKPMVKICMYLKTQSFHSIYNITLIENCLTIEEKSKKKCFFTLLMIMHVYS